MLTVQEERLLLHTAVTAGYLEPADAAPVPATSPATTTDGAPVFSPRIDELVRCGKLSVAQIQELREAVRQESAANTLTAGALPNSKVEPPRVELEQTLDGKRAAAQAAASAGSPSFVLNQTMGTDSEELPPPLFPVQRFPVENWDRYEFLKMLGQGGMGAVYKARDRRLGRVVALKFIRGDDQQMTQRFMQEARAQSRVDHPGICKVFDVGEVDGKAYIVMQFVDGLPLYQASKQLMLMENVQVIKDVAEALHAAHEMGIIHRDIKPANIMLERTVGADGVVRNHPVLMDFGLAREGTEGKGLTESGALIGTPAYMSPEQARGDVRHLDPRSDVYSLGATLYDILSGNPPFEDESVVNIILKVLNDDVKPLLQKVPNLPEALGIIVGKCLNKEPPQRYQSAKELADDLGRFLSNQRIVGRQVSLLYRLRYRAKRNKPVAALLGTLLLTLLGFGVYGVRSRVQSIQRERVQAEMAQHLGQEITKMEWLLRSARQLPLHDLGHEKVIIRQRMTQLGTELKSYGELGRGPAHYAIGRGHMALHEYPQALEQLQQAIQSGYQTADVHYALGFVLGKHFEQAMYEARLSGGGEWAKKQLREIEPKYLNPAIASLKQSRAMKTDNPGYLEALISYYQRDYPVSLRQAEAVVREAPWLYEASKLIGDIHLELALQTRDSGKYEEAEREFAEAVKGYNQAATVGQSDGEVYEGLAEAWVRQVEMAVNRGRPAEAAYIAALNSSDKIMTAEPQSTAGPLKKAYASLMSIGALGTGMNSADLIQQCLMAANLVLQKQPENPYASDVAACCYSIFSENVIAQGKDPEPTIQKAINLLETSLRKSPYFLWGHNDLAVIYNQIGTYRLLHGKPSARKYLEQSLEYETKALSLDPTYLVALQASLFAWDKLVEMASSNEELQKMLIQADRGLYKCQQVNDKYQQCYNNYFIAYAKAAQRIQLAGQDPQPRLQRAIDKLVETRKMGGTLLDTEQHAALAYFVDASNRVKLKQDPHPAIREMQVALSRCFGIAAQDAMCRTLAAQQEWVEADWLAAQVKPSGPALNRALEKAVQATESPAIYPDAWQVLAETHLRLASAAGLRQTARDKELSAGLAAVAKVFAINPNHALGHATQGALELLRARTERSPEVRHSTARSAQNALEQALKNDAFLIHDYTPLLAQAKELAAPP